MPTPHQHLTHYLTTALLLYTITITITTTPVPTQAQDTPLQLSGTIQDSLGTPTPDLRVNLQGWPDDAERITRLTTTTDDNGRYEFAVDPGVYSVDVTYFRGSIAGGRRALTVDDVEVRQTRALDIAVPPVYTVTGRIVDQDGQPVDRARLVAFQSRRFLSSASGISSDADGRFEFLAPVDHYRFFLQPPADSDTYLQIIHLAVTADTELQLALAPGRIIRGRVVDAQGNPLIRVTVEISDYTDTGPLLATATDADGAFSLTVDPRHTAYVIRSWLFSRPFLPRRIGLIPADDNTVEIVLRESLPDAYPSRAPDQILWGLATSGAATSPVLAADGRLYLSDGQFLYATGPGGRSEWILVAPELPAGQFWRITSPPAADGRGQLYLGTNVFNRNGQDAYLLAVDSRGQRRWRRAVAGSISAAPAIAADGAVYASTDAGTLHAFAAEGDEQWTFPLDGPAVAAPVVADGNVYIGTDAGTLYALAPDGSERWRRDLQSPATYAPALDRQGALYIGTVTGLQAIAADGALLWRFADQGLWAFGSPSIAADGTLYVMARTAEGQLLLALDPTGGEIWRLPFEPEYDFSRPLAPTIGADGTLYVWGSSRYLHAVDARGQILWSHAFGRAESAPAIGPDGTLYVGTGDGAFYALRTASLGLDAGPWPRFQGGLASAGRVDAPLLTGSAAGPAQDAPLYADESATRLPLARLQGLNMDARAGDLDSDGDPDLIVAHEHAPNILLLNDGGHFSDASADRIPQDIHDSEDVGLADFDRDGDLDAVVVTEDDRVDELYLNDGNGFFAAAGDRLPTIRRSNAVALGDVDGDGDMDIVIGNNGPNALYLNDGNAAFADEPLDRFPVEGTDITQDVELGDVDGDGDLDLVAGNENDNGLLLNNGDGTWSDAAAQLPARAETEETREVALGDADSDGDLDLYYANVVLFNGSGTASPQNRLLLNDGAGTFTDATARLPADSDNSFEVDFLDLDTDGDLDLAVANAFPISPYRVYKNDGAGTFTDATAEFFPPTTLGNGFDIQAFDADADGRFDLYLSSRGGSDRLLLRRGATTAVAAEQQVVPRDTALGVNYPNPFNAATTIPYRIAARGSVRLDIYSITGQRIRRLIDGVQAAGEYAARWNGRDDGGMPVASGVYLYRLRADEYQKSHKLLLIK